MLRPYQLEDKEELLNIFRLNIPQYFAPSELRDFDSYLDEYADTYFSVLQDGRIVGGVGYVNNTEKERGEITWIFFHPEVTGRGLGTMAVSRCLDILGNLPGVEKFGVRTSQLAYEFFGKLGFRIIYSEKDYWGAGLDLVEMEMDKLSDYS